MSNETDRKQQETMAMLPKIVQPPEAQFSINQIRSIIGKTVADVEYGFRQPHERVHQSEAIILHFTDGTILGIDTGSNVTNITDRRNDLEPNDFHVDLDLRLVQPPER